LLFCEPTRKEWLLGENILNIPKFLQISGVVGRKIHPLKWMI
jgi:hypothetical protein